MATIPQSKRPKRYNLLATSSKKAALAKMIGEEGLERMARKTGLPVYRLQKIQRQVEYRALQQKICSIYQPFTSNSSKRKPRQVGA